MRKRQYRQKMMLQGLHTKKKESVGKINSHASGWAPHVDEHSNLHHAPTSHNEIEVLFSAHLYANFIACIYGPEAL